MGDRYQVLWFDPGGKTGVVHAAVEGGQIVFEYDTLRAGQHHHGIREKIRYFSEYQFLLGELTVGSESFEFRKSPDSAKRREGLELVSKEYIGVMKLVCKDLLLPYREQSPSILSGGLVTNDHLDALGLLPPPPLQHNKDMIAAARHIIFYFLNTAKGDARNFIIKKYKEAGL